MITAEQEIREGLEELIEACGGDPARAQTDMLARVASRRVWDAVEAVATERRSGCYCACECCG